MYDLNKLVKWFEGEVGYLEKKSDANLGDKTANAGYNNYVKYWKRINDLGLGNYQGQAWCAAFIYVGFEETFGKDDAKKLLLHAPYINVGTLYNLATGTKQLFDDPQIGDIALFGKNQHTEFVVGVDATSFTTIGGNTSAGSSVVPNGGGVFKKTYNIATHKSKGTKFFRPAYTTKAVATLSPAPSKPASTAPASTNITTHNQSITLKAGDKIVLKNTPLYASSVTTTVSAYKSGEYYVWNAAILNGRVRICPSADKAGTKGGVTGWINVTDLYSGDGTTQSVRYITVTTSGATLYCRQTPGGTKIGSFANGTKVELLDKTNSQWYKVTGVSITGKTIIGYCNSLYLK